MKTSVELNESNFESEVLNSSQPVLVDFWAPWCGPCKQLGPVLDEIAEEQNGRVKIGKINIDDEPALALRYNIQSIPTLLYFKAGQVQQQIVGLVSKKAILAPLEHLAVAA